MGARAIRFLGLASLFALGCAGTRGPGLDPSARSRMLRLGPERTSVRYEDPHAEDKRALFERINHDRALHGIPPLLYETRAALVGDLFCLDSALTGSSGHWDTRGRAPFLRWGLAGGVDYHVENVASYSVSSGRIDRPAVDLLLESHESMMAETPPNDGHRRTILDPSLTHVGIGMASVGGHFRMTEEFTRVGFEWLEVPRVPLAAGGRAAFAGKPLPGWEIGLVEIRFERPPRPLLLAELRGRRAYGYPRPVRSLWPLPPLGVGHSEGRPGEFEVSRDGRFTLTFPLDSGPGFYFVVCYLRRGQTLSEPMAAATAAMVDAFP